MESKFNTQRPEVQEAQQKAMEESEREVDKIPEIKVGKFNDSSATDKPTNESRPHHLEEDELSNTITQHRYNFLCDPGVFDWAESQLMQDVMLNKREFIATESKDAYTEEEVIDLL